MGTPVPPIEPIPAAELCPLCWGLEKPFGPGPTPLIIQVIIADVEKGPDWIPLDGEPANGTFYCQQVPGVPCRFQFLDTPIEIFIAFESGQTRGEGKLEAVRNSFNGAILSECQLIIPNLLTSHFKNGTMTAFIATE